MIRLKVEGAKKPQLRIQGNQLRIQIASRKFSLNLRGAPGPQGPQGPQGPPGPPGGEVFLYHQSTPSDEWVVNHGLGRRPIVNTFTEGWYPMVATIVHTSEHQFLVKLSAPSKGFVLYS